jgi:ArsR family transcriptional regulator
MNIFKVYRCLSDELRLRILNLLKDGPLCVCHLLEVLGEDPVKMSKQLRYMKELGVLAGERQAQWIVYRLVEAEYRLVADNLETVRELAGEELGLYADLEKRREVVERLRKERGGCAETLLCEQREGCC